MLNIIEDEQFLFNIIIKFVLNRLSNYFKDEIKIKNSKIKIFKN
jgi:hypothetical protein